MGVEEGPVGIGYASDALRRRRTPSVGLETFALVSGAGQDGASVHAVAGA